MENDFYEQLRNLVRESGKPHYKVADDLGISQSAMSRFMRGEQGLRGHDCVGILLYMGGRIFYPHQPRPVEEDYAFIPKVKAVAGAGSSLETDGEVTGFYAFRREFLQRCHISSDNSAMMMVRGDSMEPLIRSGDTVLFDQNDTEPKDSGIYVLAYGDELVIKKLVRTLVGWEICSLNPAYPPIKVQGDEISMLKVHGRVRWFGRVID